MSSKNKGSSSSSGKGSSGPSQRQTTFFINGEGIDREVITTDICRYLGNDALVKPGTHTDPKTRISQEGFYITAYRAPTSEQLRDIRSDSAKWREERRRNSARSQGGYNQSDTQQEAMMRSNPEEARPSGFPPANYGGMPPSMNQNMGPPPAEYLGRVNFPTRDTAMAPPSVPLNRFPPYQQSDSNYTYTSSQPQPSNYSVMENSRERMDMPQGQPWNMQPSSGYPPSGAPPLTSNYGQARPSYNYSPVGGHSSVPAGYGRGEAPEGYNPYGPRDSGAQPDNQDYSYGANDDDTMDSEDSYQQNQPPPPVQPQVQPRRERERDNRERTHEEPTKRRHGHRS